MSRRRLFRRTVRHAGDIAVIMWGAIVVCLTVVAAAAMVAMLAVAIYGVLHTVGVV